MASGMLERLREYDRMVGIAAIARRYFAINAFDGIVTLVGLLAGFFTAGVRDARSVVLAGMSAAMGMGVSGFWGTYFTETAERLRALEELGEHTLTDLKPSKIGRASRVAVVLVTAIDGLSPIVATALVLLPFAFARRFDPRVAYGASLAIAFAALFALGAFLGKLSARRLWWSGVKTALAGVVATIAAALIGAWR